MAKRVIRKPVLPPEPEIKPEEPQVEKPPARRKRHFRFKLPSVPFGKKAIWILAGIFIALNFYLFWDLPNPMQLTTRPAAASTRLLDRNGKLIFEVFGEERRTPIQLSSLPKHVWQATLAAEDKDFYNHKGFSLTGYLRATLHIITGKRLEGGSTITQQLVKKALLSDDRTLTRKIRELVLSLLVETRYTKDKILEMYLNQIPYGGTAYGLESASQTYFGKSSQNLTVAEAALLAALPQAPSYYSPFGASPEAGKDRQKFILSQMLENKFLSQEEYASAAAEVLKFSSPPAIRAPHFSLWVKDLLARKYGLDMVERGGLTVTTTLDLDLQDYAQQTVASETAKLVKEHVGNGAVLVTKPNTGEILALVGSRDYFDTEHDGNVNVTRSLRQPGSSIKPINYAVALEHKFITASTVLSDKSTCFAQSNQKDYCPDNYDNQFHGPTQVRFALGNSFNIPAVKTLVLNGLTNFIASSSAFGITTWQDPNKYGPSLTLGGGEVTMQDLSTAYGVLANQGKKVSLNPILDVTDMSGKTLESFRSKKLTPEEAAKAHSYSTFRINDQFFAPLAPPDIRVISPGTAFIISHILYDNGARSATFGSSSYLNVKNHPEVSVKTGTTNDKRDNWTVGYNPDVLTAVWVGNNDNSAMTRIASGVTGASPIWNKVMNFALKDLPQHWPSQPAGVEGALVCNISGLRVPESPSPDCQPRYEYFLAGTQPPYDSGSRRDIPIFKGTQTPATNKQLAETPDQIETQNHLVISDPLGTLLCLDCAGGYGGPDLIRLDKSGKATVSSD
jgi:penicillin-binding protein 1C